MSIAEHKKNYELSDIMSHPEIFNGNYNNIIGKYLIFDEGNSYPEYDKYNLFDISKDYDKALSENDADNILKFRKIIIGLKNKTANGISPFVYEPFSREFFESEPQEGDDSRCGLKQLCGRAGIDISDIIEEADSFISKKENYSLEGFIKIGRDLQNRIYNHFLSSKNYKSSFINSVVDSDFLQRTVNLGKKISYRSICWNKISSNFPNADIKSFRIAIYKALKKKNADLPKWFEEGYAHFEEFIKNNDNFAASDFIKYAKDNCSDSCSKKYAASKTLSEALNCGIIKKTKRGCYETIKIKDSEKNIAQCAVLKFKSALDIFQESYSKLARDSLIDENRELGKSLKDYKSEFEQLNEKLWKESWNNDIKLSAIDESSLRNLMVYFMPEYRNISKDDNLDAFLKRYQEELCNKFNANLKNFDNDMDLFRGMVEFCNSFNPSLMMNPGLTFNILYLKESINNKYIRDLGNAFLKIQNNTHEGIKYLRMKTRNYKKIITKL
jgi:hypothetical protein